MITRKEQVYEPFSNPDLHKFETNKRLFAQAKSKVPKVFNYSSARELLSEELTSNMAYGAHRTKGESKLGTERGVMSSMSVASGNLRLLKNQTSEDNPLLEKNRLLQSSGRRQGRF